VSLVEGRASLGCTEPNYIEESAINAAVVVVTVPAQLAAFCEFHGWVFPEARTTMQAPLWGEEAVCGVAGFAILIWASV